ncbi:MAG: GGDEF domain-containing protein [Cellvibrionaceae bacterium]|nr:GGDEF domain-containing protein [Cellvibrionaceae bacterium]
MSSSSGDYKERYLRVLEEQELLEKQFDNQLDYLRRTVTHLSAAAQGLDKSLDAEMIGLREKLRGAKGSAVVEQMTRVHRAVAVFEQNRDSENAAAALAMSQLLNQYLSLKVPDDLKKKLERFSAGLKNNLNSYRIYPTVLGEVAKLQQLALDAAAEPPKSFLQRLKSGRRIVGAEEPAPAKPPALNNAEQQQVADSKVDMQLADEALAPSPNTSAPASGLLEDGEDGYAEVAPRIAETLQDLMEKIHANDLIQHKVDIVKARIERGMDWYALTVTLEDLRDILLLRYLDVDREFSNYLQQVNQELHSISQALGLASERDSQQSVAMGEFTDCVSSHMKKLQSSMETSVTLDQLKLEVEGHLEAIQGSLQQYQQTEHAHNEQGSLTQQLKALVDRVHSVESESKATKELLEVERYRATHDPLTDLPNREAYNERMLHELQRFQRYRHPIALAVCDVDYFKRINDTYGHQAGDKVLKLLARILSTRLRQVDMVARYGGEEFVIIMPETSAEAALPVLDKIRATVGKSAFRFKDEPVNITLSFGLSNFVSEDTVESVFNRADQALYKAKQTGRNRCVLAASSAIDSGNSVSGMDAS